MKKIELFPGKNATMSLKICEYNEPTKLYADNNPYTTMIVGMGAGIALHFKDNNEDYNVKIVFYKKQLKGIIWQLIKMYFKI